MDVNGTFSDSFDVFLAVDLAVACTTLSLFCGRYMK
jgi:hypothetical protein